MNAKTIPNDNSVTAFIESVPDAQKRADSYELVRIMSEVSGEPPKLWGASIIGFGTWHYKYASGHEGDTAKIGFSPRKAAITLYGVIFYDHNTELLPRLGPHKLGKGCLYIKRLSDVDMTTLRQMIETSYASQPKL